MGEKILFELRVNNDDNGTHIEVNASPEWRSHHRPHHRKHHLFAWTDCCGSDEHEREEGHRQPPADDLRRALDSLQSLYDDLYGSPA